MQDSGTYNTTIAITYNPTNNSYITYYGGDGFGYWT